RLRIRPLSIRYPRSLCLDKFRSPLMSVCTSRRPGAKTDARSPSIHKLLARGWALIPLFYGAAAVASTAHHFTLRNSIELSLLVNPVVDTVPELRQSQPTGKPIVSPAGRHFVLITEKGDLRSNNIVSSIWMFDVDQVGDILKESRPSSTEPALLTTLSARSNTPVISEVRWLDNSRLSFLGKTSSSFQQVFVLDTSNRRRKAITADDVYVTAYDIQDRTVAYTTLLPQGESYGGDKFIDVPTLGKADGIR